MASARPQDIHTQHMVTLCRQIRGSPSLLEELALTGCRRMLSEVMMLS